MKLANRLGPVPDLPVVHRTMSRRAFLVVGAGGAAALSGLTRLADGLGAIELPSAANPTAPLALNQTIVIRRALDQCLLTLDLYNLEPKYGGAFPVLHKPRANTPSYLSVTFEPQHVAEQSFVLTDDAAHALKSQPDGAPRSDPGTAPSAPPVDSAVAGGSQLVFIVPDGLLDPGSPNPLRYDTATPAQLVHVRHERRAERRAAGSKAAEPRPTERTDERRHGDRAAVPGPALPGREHRLGQRRRARHPQRVDRALAYPPGGEARRAPGRHPNRASDWTPTSSTSPSGSRTTPTATTGPCGPSGASTTGSPPP